MLKFAVLLILATLLCRWALGKWPWDLLAGPPTPEQKLAEARKILGVKRFSTRADIVSAHKKVIATVHPDRGGSNAQVHAANDARDLLLDALPADEIDKSADLDAKEDDPPSE